MTGGLVFFEKEFKKTPSRFRSHQVLNQTPSSAQNPSDWVYIKGLDSDVLSNTYLEMVWLDEATTILLL